jgi:signal peptide peptidase SppA
MLIRPSAAVELRSVAEAAVRAGVPTSAARRSPSRPLNLPGAVLEKAEYEGGGSFLAGGLGVVQVDGPIWYSTSAFACYCGGGSASGIIHALARFRNDTRAKAIVIDIHSPGGESMAMADLADAVRRAKAVKPVYVRMHETFSLGYAIACLGTELSMSPGTMVGSIGSIMWMVDESAALAADGVRFLAVSSGSKKIHNAPGQPLGDDVQAHMQAIVDRCGADFFALVAEGRGIDAGTVASWEGGEFFADEAKALGLVDVVETEEAFYERITKLVSNPVGGVSPAAVKPAGVAARRIKGGRMTATQNKGGVPKAMTADELYDTIASEGGFDEDTLSKIKSMIPEEEEAPASETNEEETPPPASKRSGSPASFAQLEEVVPHELPDRDTLIVAMQREGVSVSAAQARVQSAILKQFKALSEKSATDDATGKQTAPYSAGRAPVKGGNRGGPPAGNAVQRWNAAVSAVMETGKKRSDAVAAVVRSNPELHQAYLDEVNAGRAE